MGSKVYDNWGKLVEAVLRKEQFREFARCDSIATTSSISDGSSRFSFRSISDGSSRFSFGSITSFNFHGSPTSDSFWLEKKNGKKCYMLAARDLGIAWGDTPQYWQWVSESLPESRFAEVAELLDVCWLEIRGKINVSMLSPGTKYAAYFVYTSKPTLHGFDYQPVEGSVCMTGQEGKKNTISLKRQEGRRQSPARVGWFYGPARSNPSADTQNNPPKKRDDQWMEVELGEILVTGGEEGDVEMSLMEVKGGNWKRGLIIQGIEIRPKEKSRKVLNKTVYSSRWL